MDEQAVSAFLWQVLEEDGIAYTRQGGFTRFQVQRGGMRWEVNCLCRRDGVEIYGRYPFRVSDRSAALGQCGEANLRLSRGAWVLPKDGRPVFRDYVEMDDPYGAPDRLRRALEYNFRAAAWFWGRVEPLSRMDPL